MPKGSSFTAAVAIGGLVLAVLALNYWYLLRLQLMWTWLATIGVFVIFLIVLGVADKSRLFGVLINEENKISLSRLQTLIWTVIVLSALTTLGFARLRAGQENGFDIDVPSELWVALGITATALAGSPLIKAVKKDPSKKPDPDAAARTLARLGHSEAEIAARDARTDPQTERVAALARRDNAIMERTEGLVHRNNDPKDASWLDLFRGEEAGNAASLDVGKIQMFYFTILVVAIYGVAISSRFAGVIGEVPLPTDLPPFTETMVALLALSNGTYLANKAVPHTPEAPPTP